MDVEQFLKEHGLSENPFGAEEARHDPVFERIVASSGMSHPELVKVLGNPDKPHTSVVFGEKGSGKTALRLLMAERITQHNDKAGERRTLLVAYDDFNPVLDTIARNKSRRGSRRSRDPDRLLAAFRLEDHQDAILSIAVTKLVDAILGAEQHSSEPMKAPPNIDERLKSATRDTRMDIAALAALYDAPRGTGGSLERWRSLLKKLKLGFRVRFSFLKVAAVLLTVVALCLFAAPYAQDALDLDPSLAPGWAKPAAGVTAVLAILAWAAWLVHRLRVWRMARRILKECIAVDRTAGQFREMLEDLPKRDRAMQPWPRPGGDGTNARYEMTSKFVRVIGHFGHNAMVVLIDRVDEPTLVSGRPERMRRLIWPMFDSKFFQQDSIGFKLLLPLELRYLIHKEDATFFQEARLDKQSLVDRLSWSGATLYDLCTERLRACHRDHNSEVGLTDLFAEDVTRDALIEALAQMQQPRDAFKLIYAVMLAHCSNVTADDANYRIPRLTFESVRRDQAQRINELQRGLSPA
ncbi:MAG: hypothetical protein ACYTGZ_15030 [Planctomycetota bacterium]|jgi:hypothetical protein